MQRNWNLNVQNSSAVSRQSHLNEPTITITIYYYYFNWIKHGVPRTVSLVSVAGMAVRVCSMLKQNKIEISFFLDFNFSLRHESFSYKIIIT